MTLPPGKVVTRSAIPQDAAAIAHIYNQGIEDRVATFETEPRSPEQIEAWFSGSHPVLVVENGKSIVAFASSSSYRPRDCYAGVAEFSVYVAREHRGAGYGKLVMKALFEAAAEAGFWKLLSRVFPENTASLKLLTTLGFREVGLYERHAQLDGVWRDVVIVEKLL